MQNLQIANRVINLIDTQGPPNNEYLSYMMKTISKNLTSLVELNITITSVHSLVTTLLSAQAFSLQYSASLYYLLEFLNNVIQVASDEECQALISSTPLILTLLLSLISRSLSLSGEFSFSNERERESFLTLILNTIFSLFAKKEVL